MAILVDQHGNALIGPAKTASYQPIDQRWWTRPRDLPPFTFQTIQAMLLEPTVRLGLAMRAAPLISAEFAYKQGDTWVPGIEAANEVVAAFVERQLRRIWDNDIEALITSQIWGWTGAEVTLRLTESGTVEIDRLLGRHANDVRALKDEGKITGVRFLRIKEAKDGHVDLNCPYAVFHSYLPEAGMDYGSSVLLGAYSPWADKWLDGGALDVRRLFMHKDAYGGADVAYPPGNTIIDGKGTVPNRDIAREIVEQSQAGAVTVRPSAYDQHGNELWKITRASVPSSPTHILEFPKELDTEILRGMEIPDDVLTAESSGAWAGKQVPMMAFYAGLDRWLRGMVRDVVPVIRWLVKINYGVQWFQVTTKPLALQAMEQQAKSDAQSKPATPMAQGGFLDDGGDDIAPGHGQEQGAQPQGGQQPNNDQQQQQQPRKPRLWESRPARMSLDPVEAVGRGVLSATELVSAARRVIRMDVGGVSEAMPDVAEEHEFSCTMFSLPSELAMEVIAMAQRIHSDDLAGDGREFSPHITVKYGLHTDDVEEIRQVVDMCAPIAVTFGPTSVFAGEEHDVVKIEIDSEGLRKLNAKISDSLQCTDTHPTYQPHCTIAYVKPGLGERYAALLNDLQGRVVAFDRLVFSDKRRKWTTIRLGGVAKFSLAR